MNSYVNGYDMEFDNKYHNELEKYNFYLLYTLIWFCNIRLKWGNVFPINYGNNVLNNKTYFKYHKVKLPSKGLANNLVCSMTDNCWVIR